MTEAIHYCAGCGARLQTENKNRSGYVPEGALTKEGAVCRRCFRIRHYNEVSPVELTADDYRAVLDQIGQSEALVVQIVDIFDLEGSWVRGLPRRIGANPLLLVANKLDLLPASTNWRRLEQWLRHECLEWGVRPLDVALCSVKKGTGMEDVVQKIEQYRDGRDVYIVGATNVGKSSFMNRILKDYGEGEGNEMTTSFYPGTTLGTVGIALEDGRELIDTPGIVNEDRLSERIAPHDLRYVVPTARLNPKVFQLNAEQTLFFGGLTRFDFKRGERQPFVCYGGRELYIHRTKLANADQLYREQRGKLLVPPTASGEVAASGPVDRLSDSREGSVSGDPISKDSRLGDPVAANALDLTVKRSFRIDGEKTDIVISGLGWLTCRGDAADIDVYVPRGVAVSVRPAII